MQIRILPKLLVSFLILSVIPLIILGYIANQNLNDTGLQAVQQAEEMGRLNIQAAKVIGETAIDDSVRSLDRKATEAIELRTVELAMSIADFLYERDNDILVLASLNPDPDSYLHLYKASKKDVVLTGTWPETKKSKASELRPKNPENKEEWRHRPPPDLRKTSRPLYREITFIDLKGMEKIKIAEGKISDRLLDVSKKENTYCRAEDYFSHLDRLKKGEIYVSNVIGPYIPGWIYKTPEGIAVKPESAYAGRENPHGKKFVGIIRWVTPVLNGKGMKTGYVTLALDHTHIMEFTDHILPTEERFTTLSDGGSGNYAFIWDNHDRCISHARDFFINGFNPENGKATPGWISQEVYNQYKESGLPLDEFTANLPSFHDFSQKKPGAVEQVQSGRIPLDCRILDTAPQCQGWHEGTADGGSGSFLILWSGLWKLTTHAAIPYYTGVYGQSRRGFGYVTIGANVDDFHRDANITKSKIEKSIAREANVILATNARTREMLRKSADHNRNVMIIIVILTGLSIIGAALLISLNITRPLRRLTEGAVAMSKGNLHQVIKVQTNDEIG